MRVTKQERSVALRAIADIVCENSRQPRHAWRSSKRTLFLAWGAAGAMAIIGGALVIVTAATVSSSFSEHTGAQLAVLAGTSLFVFAIVTFAFSLPPTWIPTFVKVGQITRIILTLLATFACGSFAIMGVMSVLQRWMSPERFGAFDASITPIIVICMVGTVTTALIAEACKSALLSSWWRTRAGSSFEARRLVFGFSTAACAAFTVDVLILMAVHQRKDFWTIAAVIVAIGIAGVSMLWRRVGKQQSEVGRLRQVLRDAEDAVDEAILVRGHTSADHGQDHRALSVALRAATDEMRNRPMSVWGTSLADDRVLLMLDYLAAYFRGPLTRSTLKSFPPNVQQATNSDDRDLLPEVRTYLQTLINQLER